MDRRLKMPLPKRRTRRSRLSLRLMAVSVAAASQAILAPFRPGSVFGAPKGGRAVHGSVTITQNGDTTIITASNHSIINFSSFDIANGETVQIVEPSARSKILERILGGAPTLIDGSLISNGRVYMVNPDGITFGADAHVSVGGLTAVAGELSNADFLAGVNHFTNLSGSVINQGQITSSGPTVLAGAQVSNGGTIAAGNNTVVLAAGSAVLVGTEGSSIYAQVTPQASSLAANTPGSGDIYSLALGMGSRIAARNIVVNGGGGNVQVSGTLDASTNQAGAQGGSVSVTGGNVALTGATVNASGPGGGGSIMIGGGPHADGNIASSQQTTISADSSLSADALTDGAGGHIVIWSDQATGFAGSISAQGAGTGVGGTVEISSGGNLAFTGIVNGYGPGGAGTLLMDPATFTIDAPTASAIETSMMTMDVTETATSEIFVQSAVDISTGLDASHTLTLDAPTIDLSAPITIAISGQLIGGATVVQVDLHSGGLIQNGIDLLPTSGGTMDIDSGYTSAEDVSIDNKQVTLVNLGGSSASTAVHADSWSVTSPITLAGAFAGDTTGGSAFSFTQAVLLDGDVTLSAPHGGDISFGSTVDGAFNLEVNSGGATEEFLGTVGGTTPLQSLKIDGTGGTTTLAGNVTTLHGQTYGDAVTLSGSAITVTDTGGEIIFASTVSGSNTALTAFGAGGNIFDATVNVQTLHTMGAGGTTLGGDVTTTGGQTYGDAVSLTGASVTVSDSTGAITFTSTITGTSTALTALGGAGNIFDGSVNVLSLHVAGAAGTTLAGNVTTSAGQTYSDALTLSGSSVTVSDSAGVITFVSTVTGTGTAFTASGAGGNVFDTTVNVLSLHTTGAGGTTLDTGVTTTAGQTYGDAVTFASGSITMEDTGTGVITFASGISGSNTVLTVLGNGGNVFDGAINLKSLYSNNSIGNTTIGGFITTSAGQTYADAVTLTGSTVTLTDNTGVITFDSTITGTGTSLSVFAAGGNVFENSVNVGSLQTSGAAGTTLEGNVTTSGGQTYGDAVTLIGASLSVSDTGTGIITFDSTVTGTSTAFTAAGAGGNVFESTVNVLSLSTAGAGGTTLESDVTTTAGQTYGDAVTLIGPSITVTDNSGVIAFDSGITGTGTALTVEGQGGNVFEGSVDVQSLYVAGGAGTTLEGNITTSNGQTYTDAVTLMGASVTVTDSAGVITFESTVTGTSTALTASGAGGNFFDISLQVLSLHTSGAGGTTISCDVTTSAGQTYGDALTLIGASRTLVDTGGVITFDSTVTGTGTALTVTGAGGSVFDGAVNVQSLDVNGAGPITLAGDVTTVAGQTYSEAVTLGGSSVTLSDNTGVITFDSTITGTGTALIVDGEEGNFFDASVNVLSLHVGGGSGTNLGGDVTTSAGQTYSDAVSLSGLSVTLTDSGGEILFASTVTGTGTALTVSGAGGNEFDQAVDVLSLHTSGGGTTLESDVTTTAGQTYGDAVTLVGPSIEVSDASGAIIFDSTITGTGTALTVDGQGGNVFDGAVNVQSLLVSGGAGTTLGGNVTTTAGQTYTGAVTLTGPSITVTDNTGVITFESTITGTGTALTASAAGGNVFDNPIDVLSLHTTGAGGTTLANDVTTSAGQTYSDAVTLSGGAITVTDSAGVITFASTVTGTGTALTASGAGGNVFDAQVNVLSLHAIGAGGTTLESDVTSTAGQTYGDAVTLMGASVTITDNTSIITFDSTITGTGTALTVTGQGGNVFDGAVNVQSLLVNGATGTTLGGNVTTSNGQTYVDAVTLSGTSVTVEDTAGQITFESTVTGTSTALTASGAGGNFFDAAVDVLSLHTTGAGGTTLSADVTTSNGQTYGDALTLTGLSRVLTDTGGVITFDSTVTGTGTALTVTGGAGSVFDGAVDVQSLKVGGAGGITLAANVTTTAGQTYNEAVTLSGVSVTVTDSAGIITFNSTITGTGTALTASAAGGNVFENSVNVLSLQTSGAGGTTLRGDVTTSGGQTYGDAVTLSGGTQTLTDSAGVITFDSTITGTGTSLTVSGAGGNVFESDVNVLALHTSGARGTTLEGNVTTSNGQTYSDAVTLVGPSITVTDSAGIITFASTVTGTGTALTATGSGGNVFDGNVNVLSLYTSSGGGTTLGANVTTTAGQTYTDSVTLTGPSVTVTDNAGVITFDTTITGTGTALTVSGAGGNFFGNTVDVLSLHATGAGGTTLETNVTTSAGQTYSDAVTLIGGSVTVTDSAGVITFASTVTGAGTALTASGAGGNVFDNAVNVLSLNTSGAGGTALGGNVTTTTGQTYGDAVTLSGGAITVTDDAGVITFESTVTGTGTVLTASGAGGNVFDGTVKVLSLDTTGAGGTTLAANVTTTGGQTYGDAVTLSGLSVTVTDNAGVIAFDSTVTGTGTALTASGAGGNVFDGDVNVLSLHTTGAGGTTLEGNVTTTSGQTYSDAITLVGPSITVTDSAGVITFVSTVTGTSTALTASGAGGNVFDGTVRVLSLDTTGAGGTTLAANITTTAGQTYGDAVTLSGAAITVTDNSGIITFDSTVTGTGTALTASGAGGNVFENNVNVLSLHVTGAGGTTLEGNVTTSAGQSYSDAVTLSGGAITVTDSAGVITFASTVTGTGTALTASGAGGNVFDNTVNVLSLHTSGAGGTTLAGNITTTAGQTYGDAVTLSGAAITVTDSAAVITFDSTVTGAGTALTASGAGGNIFDSTVRVLSLNTSGAGGTTLEGDVTTTGGQTYGDAVTLVGPSITVTDSVDAITFTTSVTGVNTALTSSGAGGNFFDGPVDVKSLHVTGAGGTTLSGNVNITTTNGQTYSDAVTVTGANVTITDGTGAIVFGSTVTGTGTNLTVSGAGGDIFDGNVNVESLHTTGAGGTTLGANVTTSGGQTYGDAVTLMGPSVTVTDSSGIITFDSTVTGTGTALTALGAGGNVFDGNVDVLSLSTNGAGGTTLGANVTTSAGQTYGDAVTLTGASQTLTDAIGAITFDSTLTGTGTALTVSGNGGNFFDDVVDLLSLHTTGAGGTTLGSDVTTAGGQTYGDAVTVTGDQTLIDPTGAIVFTSTLTGTGTDLFVMGAGGNIFDGNVNLKSLSTSGAGGTTLGANVTTAAGQTYGDAVTLTGASQTLTDPAGEIIFDSTVSGTGTALTTSGVGGNIFDATVDVLSLHTTGAGGTTLSMDVTTTAGQTYSDAVTLVGASITVTDSAGVITFASTVTGTGTALTASGAGGNVFDGAVDVLALNAMGSGGTTLGRDVTTTGGQTYADAVTLSGASITVTDNAGIITFESTVTGTGTALNASGAGGNVFDANVNVQSLNVTGAGGTTIQGNVTTTAGQTYGDAVTLIGAAQTFTDSAGVITFISTLTGTGTALTLSGAGGNAFESTVDLLSLHTSGAGGTTLEGDVTTTAGQTYGDAVTLVGPSITVTDSAGVISFASTVTGASTALTASGAGGNIFDGNVNVLSLGTTGAGGTTLGANVTTTAGQTYGDAVTLTGASITVTDSTGAITFSTTVTGTGSALTASGAGGNFFDASVDVLSLHTTGAGGTTLSGNVTTTAGQTYSDAVTLIGPAITVTDSTGAITFASTLTGTSTALTASGAGGNIFDSSVNLLSLHTTGAGGTTLAGNITTTAGQTYGDAVSLVGTSITVTDGTGAITFASTVTGVNTNLTADGVGGNIFDSTVKVLSLNMLGAGGTTLEGNVTTTGGQTYGDAVTLVGPSITVTDNTDAITFTTSVTGVNTALTSSGAGGNFFDGPVDVKSLHVTGAGGTVLSGNITTTNGQTYSDAVTVTGVSVTITDGTGAIVFGSTVTGTSTNLTVSGAGGDIFEGDVNVESLHTTGAGGTTLGANITTTAGQTYGDAVTLTGAGVTVTDDAGEIIFTSTITGTGTALTASGAGGNIFDASVNVFSLDTSGAGGTTLVADVTTSGGQTYGDAVTLTSAVQTFSDPSGAITFDSTLTGTGTALTVSGNGGNFFDDVVDLLSLHTTGAGGTTLGSDVTTTAGQTYGDAVTVTGDQTLTDSTGAITFTSTLTGTGTDLNVLGAGGNFFEGDVNLKSLNTGGAGGTTIAGNVTTTAGQTYGDAVTLTGSDQTFSDTTGAITFVSTLTGVGSNLTVSAAGGNFFDSTVDVASLYTLGPGGTTLGGDVTTTGGQTYGDAVTVTGDQTLTDATGAITFTSTLTGINTDLFVFGAGGVFFDGTVDLKSLDVGGGRGTTLEADVTTAAGQTYNDAVTLIGPEITLVDTGGIITFESGVTGKNTRLDVDGAGGNIFKGTADLMSINTSGAGGTTIIGLMTTTNGQTYGDALTLGPPYALLSDPTTINFLDKIFGTGRVIGNDLDTHGQVFTITTIFFSSNTQSNLSEFTDQNFSLINGAKSLELATVIAGAITFEAPEPVATPTSLTPSERQDLLLLGIYVKSESDEVILGNPTYGIVIVDWPPIHQPRPEDRKVTPVRLEAQRVKQIVAEVEQVVGPQFANQKQITDLIAAGVTDFRGQTKPTDDKVAPQAFAHFILTHQATPAERTLAAKLLEMRQLADNISGLGLSTAETQGANQYWSSSLTPDDENLVDKNGDYNQHWLLDVLYSLPASQPPQ